MKKFILFFALLIAGFISQGQTASTTISAQISKGDGDITAIQWTKVSGPNSIKIETPNQAITNVSDLVEGVYRLQLFAKDSNGFTDTKFINITVLRALNCLEIKIEADKVIRISKNT